MTIERRRADSAAAPLPQQSLRAVAMQPSSPQPSALNRVPAVILYFWVIKVLCTTVGETAADYLNEELNLGLLGTTLVMTLLFVVALFFQFRAKRYVPWIYWLVVVSISVVGTLITDNLTDSVGVPLAASTLVFAVALSATFVAWYRAEGTLSIRSIVTARREAFYWAVVLLTFALGTAAGDWLAEGLALGYVRSAALFAAAIAAVIVAYRWLGLPSVVAFWAAYISTRPLGASLGDYLAQAPEDGGLGFGPVVTSALFIGSILAAVGYLSVTKRDVLAAS
jgi:uncharacterized membrane-anchored protein